MKIGFKRKQDAPKEEKKNLFGKNPAILGE
jgi:hypothetical protein